MPLASPNPVKRIVIKPPPPPHFASTTVSPHICTNSQKNSLSCPNPPCCVSEGMSLSSLPCGHKALWVIAQIAGLGSAAACSKNIVLQRDWTPRRGDRRGPLAVIQCIDSLSLSHTHTGARTHKICNTLTYAWMNKLLRAALEKNRHYSMTFCA